MIWGFSKEKEQAFFSRIFFQQKTVFLIQQKQQQNTIYKTITEANLKRKLSGMVRKYKASGVKFFSSLGFFHVGCWSSTKLLDPHSPW